MSYYDPHIYNKQNLKEKDLKELSYYEGEFCNAVESAKEDYLDEISDKLPTLKKLVGEIIGDFIKECKVRFGYALHDMTVSIIDNYDADVDEVDNPETFLYKDDDEAEIPEEDAPKWEHTLDDVDLREIRDRFGQFAEDVVRDMLTGKNERWTENSKFHTDGSEGK
jgi:hypothetical protein